VFAAYAEGRPNALAQGGRYDEIGKAFGRARPATGFSMDLRALAAVGDAGESRAPVLAPYAPRDAGLQRRITALRARGTPVIVALPGHAAGTNEMPGAHRLVQRAGKWAIETPARREAPRKRAK